MKKILLSIAVAATTFASAQTQLETFDALPLAADTFWNGSDMSGEIQNIDYATFPNTYDSAWAYWAGGWSYSNLEDPSETGNPHNAFSATDVTGNGIYLNGKNNSTIFFDDTINGVEPNSVYVNNSGYAGNSMLTGDLFGKQFGSLYDANGDLDSTNGEDWFLLTIYGYDVNNVLSDSVEFYLADYRFADSTQDYIVDEWTMVDMSTFGAVRKLEFKLSSSDVGNWGMNTPNFFCLDELSFDIITSVDELAIEKLQFFPNPAVNQINFKEFQKGSIKIFDLSGKLVANEYVNGNSFDISFLKRGMYQLVFSFDGKTSSAKLIKE